MLMSVEGIPPEARLSHSACRYKEGVVVFGGLGRGGVPLGDTTFLRPMTTGFCWESLAVHPQPVPRYTLMATPKPIPFLYRCGSLRDLSLISDILTMHT